MNFSGGALAAGFVFGVFGFYFVKQAKQKSNIPHLIIGITLMIYPYFIENTYLLWGIGSALLFLGYRTSSSSF